MGEPLKKEDIRRVLEFYRAIGVESVPCEPKARPGTKAKARRLKTAEQKKGREEKQKALQALFNEEIKGCTGCKLSAGRHNIVFGEGNPAARLMFIGEAPGREEDLQGRPFVGDAGKLLTSLIEKMGFSREDVFIANIVKCRPEGNRDPEEDEIEACLPFLKKQIGIIAPEAIMALGRVASQTLLGTTVQISRLRGNFKSYEGIPLMPTFHPAYLLRNRKDKALTWQDAMQVLKLLGMDAG